ncbi:MAG: flagellar filament capping protein FliD [bacterium]
MAITRITGVTSGIDWQETISLLMQIESQPVVALEERKGVYEDKLSAWQEINTKLLTLKSTMEEMDTLGEMLVKAATSSDTNVLTAAANSDAAVGSYSVLVNQLALSHKLTHGGFTDLNTTPVTTTSEVFAYTYGGVDYSVNVNANTTLSGLAAAINNDINNPGVTATILNDGGTSNAYHLVLTGETGATNTIAINDTLTTLTNFETANFSTTQTAQDAQIRVDGYPSGSWILSATNEVTGVIAGVTLNLKTTSATAETVTITNDMDAAKEQIEAFVNAYNEVVSLINLKTLYDTEEETAGILFGDSSVIGIKGSLQSIIASTVPGLLDNAVYKSLSEIGVKSGSGGLLSIDDSKLSDALEDNFDAVGKLFSFSSTSNSNNLTYFTRSSETQGGVYTVVANYDASGLLTSATINGNTALLDGNYVIGASGNPEEGLWIAFAAPSGGSPGSVTAEVRVATGSAVQIANKVSYLTDSTDGTVHNAQEGIQDSIDDLDDQITTWGSRLAATQEQLERDYLTMEIMLFQLQNQSSYLGSLLSSL